MEIEEFEKAMDTNDFAVGDSFWMGDWEFEVVNRDTACFGNEVVFRWELTRQEFVHILATDHPRIADPDAFFERNKTDILHRFQKGFDALVGECGATYETLMEDAINEAIGLRSSEEGDSSPSLPCSDDCQEVARK